MNYYVVFDLQPNDNPIFAVCLSLEEANKKLEKLAKEFAEELLNADPSETGLNKNYQPDVDRVYNDCRNSIGIQIVEREKPKDCFVAHTKSGYIDFYGRCNFIDYNDPNYVIFKEESSGKIVNILGLIPHSEIKGIEGV